MVMMIIMIVMTKKMDLQHSMIRTSVLLLDDGDGDGDESEAFLTNHLILGMFNSVIVPQLAAREWMERVYKQNIWMRALGKKKKIREVVNFREEI